MVHLYSTRISGGGSSVFYFILRFFWEEGRGTEMNIYERAEHQLAWLPPSHLYQGSSPKPGHVVWPGIKLVTPPVHRTRLNPLSHTGWAELLIFWHICFESYFKELNIICKHKPQNNFEYNILWFRIYSIIPYIELKWLPKLLYNVYGFINIC